MKLIERFVAKANILESDRANLPDKVLLRVSYPVCNIGELNANNRVYERDVWEKVLQEEDLQKKMSERTLYGEGEHPEETQSNLMRTSHIITEMWIDEDSNKVMQTMEVLDTPTGQIIETLFRAGCKVGVSTRAEGDLEEFELEESDGGKKSCQRVVPESYNYVTTDFTADPSTFGVEPQSVEMNLVPTASKLAKEGKMNLAEKQYLMGLLESIQCEENQCTGGCSVGKVLSELKEEVEKSNVGKTAGFQKGNLLKDAQEKYWVVQEVQQDGITISDPGEPDVAGSHTKQLSWDEVQEQGLEKVAESSQRPKIKESKINEEKYRKVKLVRVEEIPDQESPFPEYPYEEGYEKARSYIGKVGKAYSVLSDDFDTKAMDEEGAFIVKFEDGQEGGFTNNELEFLSDWLEESKVNETVQELVGEIPGINRQDQEILNMAIDQRIIPNIFPPEEDMIDVLASYADREHEAFLSTDLEGLDMGEIPAVYLKYVLLPKAKEFYKKFELNPKIGEIRMLGKDNIKKLIEQMTPYKDVEKLKQAILNKKVEPFNTKRKDIFYKDIKFVKESPWLLVVSTKFTNVGAFKDKPLMVVYSRGSKDQNWRCSERGAESPEELSGMYREIPEEDWEDQFSVGTLYTTYYGLSPDPEELRKKGIDPSTTTHTGPEKGTFVQAGGRYRYSEEQIKKDLKKNYWAKNIEIDYPDEKTLIATLDSPRFKKRIASVYKKLPFDNPYSEYHGQDFWTLVKTRSKALPSKVSKRETSAEESKVNEDEASDDVTAFRMALENFLDNWFTDHPEMKKVSSYQYRNAFKLAFRDQVVAKGLDVFESKDPLKDLSNRLIDLRVSEASAKADRDTVLEQIDEFEGLELQSKILQSKLNARLDQLSEAKEQLSQTESELTAVRSMLEKKAKALQETKDKLDKSVENQKSLDVLHKEYQEELVKTANESIQEGRKEVIKEYFDYKIKQHQLQIDENTRALLEDCQNLQDVNSLMGKLVSIARRSALHSKPLTEVQIQEAERKDPEQEKVNQAVGQFFKRFG